MNNNTNHRTVHHILTIVTGGYGKYGDFHHLYWLLKHQLVELMETSLVCEADFTI
jgi:hypothetical protein